MRRRRWFAWWWGFRTRAGIYFPALPEVKSYQVDFQDIGKIQEKLANSSRASSNEEVSHTILEEEEGEEGKVADKPEEEENSAESSPTLEKDLQNTLTPEKAIFREVAVTGGGEWHPLSVQYSF